MIKPQREHLPSGNKVRRTQKEERIKFGQYLKERRRLLNLTQENVADKLCITVTAYSKIERGDSGVNMDRIRQLADALEMNLFELIENKPVGNVLLKELYMGMLSLRDDVHTITELLVSESGTKYYIEKKRLKTARKSTKTETED